MNDSNNGGSFETLSEFSSIAKKIVATGASLDEANTKAKIITPFIRTLGWRVYNNDEVLLEYSGEEGFNDRVDYALFGPDGLYAVVEAKQIGRTIANDDSEIIRYMRLLGAEWGLLTNGERYLIYQDKGEDEELGEELVEAVDLGDLPNSSSVQYLKQQCAYSESSVPDQPREKLPEITRKTQEEIEHYINKKLNEDKQTKLDSRFGLLYDSLIESLAPTVPGHEEEKFGLLLSLFGGVPKSIENERAVRGAVHVLIVHDPGTLTGDLIESMNRFAPKAVSLSGESSGVGLLEAQNDSRNVTAKKVSEYSVDTLAGASHVLVSRFDNINEDGFHRIQDAFSKEQQSTGIDSRSEIQKTTALVATTRPKYGRFDQYEPIVQQIDFDPELISKFDLIFTVADTPDAESDERIAEDILTTNYSAEVDSHLRNNQSDTISNQDIDEISGIIGPDLMRKYAIYADQTCRPRMTSEARDTLKEFYIDIREQCTNENSPVPMTARKLESLVRLAEASARIRLSDEVTQEDAERVIDLVQKSMEDLGFDPKDKEYDVDMIGTGAKEVKRERVKSMKQLMEHLEEQYEEGIPLDVIVDTAEEVGVDTDRVEDVIHKMKMSGELYEVTANRYRLA